jgi:hypothetical protein
MKRYDCYYTNDFGNDYPAFSKETEDGDWVSFSDHAAELTEALAMGQTFKDIADELRDDLHKANNTLTSAQLERDIARADVKRLEARCEALAFLLYGDPTEGEKP